MYYIKFKAESGVASITFDGALEEAKAAADCIAEPSMEIITIEDEAGNMICYRWWLSDDFFSNPLFSFPDNGEEREEEEEEEEGALIFEGGTFPPWSCIRLDTIDGRNLAKGIRAMQEGLKEANA